MLPQEVELDTLPTQDTQEMLPTPPPTLDTSLNQSPPLNTSLVETQDTSQAQTPNTSLVETPNMSQAETPDMLPPLPLEEFPQDITLDMLILLDMLQPLDKTSLELQDT